MAYTDKRRHTVSDVLDAFNRAMLHWRAAPVVYLREEDGVLRPTNRVTDLLRCEVVRYRNLGDRRGYAITVKLPDGTQRQWGGQVYDGKTYGVGGGQTVWTTHPKGNGS